jgi:hypothetical protein
MAHFTGAGGLRAILKVAKPGWQNQMTAIA